MMGDNTYSSSTAHLIRFSAAYNFGKINHLILIFIEIVFSTSVDDNANMDVII